MAWIQSTVRCFTIKRYKRSALCVTSIITVCKEKIQHKWLEIFRNLRFSFEKKIIRNTSVAYYFQDSMPITTHKIFRKINLLSHFTARVKNPHIKSPHLSHQVGWVTDSDLKRSKNNEPNLKQHENLFSYILQEIMSFSWVITTGNEIFQWAKVLQSESIAIISFLP